MDIFIEKVSGNSALLSLKISVTFLLGLSE